MTIDRILGPVSPPSLQDIINSVLVQAQTAINAVKIGTIQSYNPLLGTCTLKINSKIQLEDNRVFDYPTLIDCPVYMVSGGDAYLSMPIQAGDTCIVLFNDYDIDNWFIAGGANIPASNRKHSIADGIALVGIRGLTNPNPVLANIVELYANTHKLAIGNAVTSLYGIMNRFIDTLTAATVQGPSSTFPFTAVTIAALNVVKAEVATLLDQGSSPT